MDRQQTQFVFLNLGHFFDHLLPLVFATVAAVTLYQEWGMTYDKLALYAMPGILAFGLGALPAGWLADRWSREGMMLIFFLGIGASAVATAFARTPIEIAVGLFAVGLFGAIYHPVGLAMVIQGRQRTGLPLAVNGIFGNLGVACAALFAGFLIDFSGWRAAFIWPGTATLLVGLAYAVFLLTGRRLTGSASLFSAQGETSGGAQFSHRLLIRILAVVFFSTAIGGLIFQCTTFALPKVMHERLAEMAVSASQVGWYVFVVFACASVGQLIVGFMVDRWSLKRIFLGIALFQVGFFLLMIGQSGVSALVIAIAFMLVVFGQIPINDVLIGRVTKTNWRSRVLAIRYVITFSIGMTSVPIIALVYAHLGFDELFMILAGLAVLIFSAVAFLPRASSPAT